MVEVVAIRDHGQVANLRVQEQQLLRSTSAFLTQYCLLVSYLAALDLSWLLLEYSVVNSLG